VILTSELSEISQLQCFRTVDPLPLQISIHPPDHTTVGVFLYQLLHTNPFFKKNSVLNLQDMVDLVYLSQDHRGCLKTLSFLGPRQKTDFDERRGRRERGSEGAVEDEEFSFVDWAKSQG
jgi:hypothetical protein